MSERVVVINPNSSQLVTAAIARAVSVFEIPGVVRFDCVTLTDGPPGIVSQRDADRAAPMVTDYIAAHAHEASGFIIACYSDPGLHAAREVTALPVLGIGESALQAAFLAGQRVGVIAVSSQGIPRHWRAYRAMGHAERIVGERAIDLSVEQSGDDALATGRLIDTARLLRESDGAQAIVLGCAGMADLRQKVALAVDMPVIDPCSVAAAAMVTLIRERKSA